MDFPLVQREHRSADRRRGYPLFLVPKDASFPLVPRDAPQGQRRVISLSGSNGETDPRDDDPQGLANPTPTSGSRGSQGLANLI